MADQNLHEYVRAALAHGKSKEEMYAELLAQGWTVTAIQEAFDAPHPEDATRSKEESRKWMIRLLAIIGAVLVGAGVFSFVASNWRGIPAAAKIGIILAAMFFFYAAGWYVKEKTSAKKTGEALILLGTIIYGAGIFLVAQIFHIRANWPDGMILWMLGALAMGFAAELYTLFGLALLVGLIPVIGQPFSFLNDVPGDPFLLTSSILLVVAAAATFWTGLVMRKRMPPEAKTLY